MKNLRNATFIIATFIFQIFFNQFVFSERIFDNGIKIYVMLDVDGTITQRIDPNDAKTIAQVEEAGFHCYRLKFTISKFTDQKYYRIYLNMCKNEILRSEQKINVKILDESTLEIEEVVVVRPAMKAFLEKVDNLNSDYVTVKFYIASRNDDVRSQNLIDYLKINTNGVPFKKKVKPISRENFRVYLHSSEEGLIKGKSAALIRAKFENEKGEKIEPNAYIVFVDNIVPGRFVKGDRDLGYLLRPTRFNISNLNEKDIQNDYADFEYLFQNIRALTKIPVRIIED